MEKYINNRNFMKSNFDEDFISDQQKGLKQPPLAKPYDENSIIIDLPQLDDSILKNTYVNDIIFDRKSHREYINEEMTLDQLSYLLYSTQGIKEVRGDNYAAVRPVASAGARHPYETYIAVKNVIGLKEGLYRYLPLEHKLLFIYEEDLKDKISEGTLGQSFISTAAVTFIWTCIPYRGEWRYDLYSHKIMLIDAGHICHALYISAGALGFGTCAIAAYDQEKMDELVRVDGVDEFVVYLAPVGKI